jgi:hypothetical protein
MNELLNEILIIYPEALRRLGQNIYLSNTQIAAWFSFFCDIQNSRLNAMVARKTHSWSVFFKGFARPRSYTDEINKAFEEMYLQIFSEVETERNNPVAILLQAIDSAK